jgi:5-methylcytosine-specific restriction endonuclease McrA
VTLHVCSVPGCPTLTPNTKCAVHRNIASRARGTTTEQGYGWTHQQRRAQLLDALLDPRCPDCGNPMTTPTDMVADHSTPLSHNRNSTADRVHCRTCSNRQGGQLAQRNRHE